MCFISHRTVLVTLLIIIYSLHIERLPKYHVCGLIKLLFPNDRSLNTYQYRLPIYTAITLELSIIR